MFGRNEMYQHKHRLKWKWMHLRMKNGNNQGREIQILHMKSGDTKNGGEEWNGLIWDKKENQMNIVLGVENIDKCDVCDVEVIEIEMNENDECDWWFHHSHINSHSILNTQTQAAWMIENKNKMREMNWDILNETHDSMDKLEIVEWIVMVEQSCDLLMICD